MTTDAAVAPPICTPALATSFYLSPDSRLRLSSWNSAAGVTLTLTGQLLRGDGCVVPFVYTQVPTTARVITQTVFAVGDGWILDAQVQATAGTVLRGQCFVRLELIQGREGGTQSLGTIIQGYARSAHVIAYPGSPIESSIDGRGLMRSITGTDPPPNGEISETVPTGARWRFVTLVATLVTDANVAARTAGFNVDDGTNILLTTYTNTTQAAGSTMTYDAGAWGTFGSVAGAYSLWALQPDLILAAGYRLRTVTNNRQVGDNWGAPQYLVEEWIDVG